MKIQASVSIVPIEVAIEVPDDTPLGEMRDRVIGQARCLLASNGAEHVILAADMPDLVDGMAYLADLGFPVLVEHVMIESPEPDWNELAEAGITRTLGRRREDEDLRLDGMPDRRD